MGLIDAMRHRTEVTHFHQELDSLYAKEGITAVIAAIDGHPGSNLESTAREAARHFEATKHPGAAFKIAKHYGDDATATRMYQAALDSCDEKRLYDYALKLARIMGDKKAEQLYAGLMAGASVEPASRAYQQSI